MSAHSLALCFDAPMQSWGVKSRGIIRDAGTEPSKSGVVGLLGAALGIARDDHAGIAELARLKMGVRVDREGVLERDFHTVQNVPTTTGSGHRTAISHRYYLADALFLVVLQDEGTDRLTRIRSALRSPVWPVFFGRRAFPPARPLVASGQPDEPPTGLGLMPQPIVWVLEHHPWLENRADLRDAERKKEESDRTVLRTIVDCAADDPVAETRPDRPISFARMDRQFTARAVKTGRVMLTDPLINGKVAACS